MEAKAVAKYIRMSPQKVRLVVDLVRGKKVEEAKQILLFTRKYAADPVSKVLQCRRWPMRSRIPILMKISST